MQARVQPPLSARRILTVQQAAAWLQVHPESVRRWIRQGRMRGVLVGGTRTGYRIDERELYRFFDSQAAASSVSPR
jgi:excisionase family DNA binding protein